MAAIAEAMQDVERAIQDLREKRRRLEDLLDRDRARMRQEGSAPPLPRLLAIPKLTVSQP